MPRWRATSTRTASRPTTEAGRRRPKTKKPVENGARNIWVNETALTTALNTSYFAQSVAMFAIVMGIALLLVGFGFLVLTLGPLANRERRVAPVAVTQP